jgi:hypothetical protein
MISDKGESKMKKLAGFVAAATIAGGLALAPVQDAEAFFGFGDGWGNSWGNRGWGGPWNSGYGGPWGGGYPYYGGGYNPGYYGGGYNPGYYGGGYNPGYYGGGYNPGYDGGGYAAPEATPEPAPVTE